jgi:hypothetical protein
LVAHQRRQSPPSATLPIAIDSQGKIAIITLCGGLLYLIFNEAAKVNYKKRGPKPTGKTPMIGLRLAPAITAKIDAPAHLHDKLVKQQFSVWHDIVSLEGGPFRLIGGGLLLR